VFWTSHASKHAGSSGVAWLHGCTHSSQLRQAWFIAHAPMGLSQLWTEQFWQVLPGAPLDDEPTATDEVPAPDELDELDPPLHISTHAKAAAPEIGQGVFERHVAMQSSCAFA
jgi:hypothetical protein